LERLRQGKPCAQGSGIGKKLRGAAVLHELKEQAHRLFCVRQHEKRRQRRAWFAAEKMHR